MKYSDMTLDELMEDYKRIDSLFNELIIYTSKYGNRDKLTIILTELKIKELIGEKILNQEDLKKTSKEFGV